jgi:hypothetical protein
MLKSLYTNVGLWIGNGGKRERGKHLKERRNKKVQERKG